MGIAAPIISSEMNEWVALGGGNSGIVGDANHSFGFHVAADELPSSDYSRTVDPQGSDGPYVNWDYSCAGDFSHHNDETLRAKHATVLARLMAGEMSMICEFIGKPFSDQPVLYWARWNGIKTLQRYTGQGHDTWSHISWYRSMVDQRAGLWTPINNVVGDEDMPKIFRNASNGDYGISGGSTWSHLGTMDLVYEACRIWGIDPRLDTEGGGIYTTDNDRLASFGVLVMASQSTPPSTPGGPVAGPVNLTEEAYKRIYNDSLAANQKAEDS
jgi:hypothetical protein